MRVSVLVVAGALLLVAGAHLLQASRTDLGIPMRVGPVTVTLEPGGTYRYVFQWRVVSQNPRVVSEKGYLLHESLAGPVSCRSLPPPFTSIQTGCSWKVFAVKLAGVEPEDTAANLTLVVRRPDGSYTAQPLKLRGWVFVRVGSTEPYTTYILNTGTAPAKVTVYYGVGSLEETKPYTVHALLLLAAGLALVVGAVIIMVRQVLRSS